MLMGSGIGRFSPVDCGPGFQDLDKDAYATLRKY